MKCSDLRSHLAFTRIFFSWDFFYSGHQIKKRKLTGPSDTVLENNLWPPANWRERGLASPSLRATGRREPRVGPPRELGSPRGPQAAARWVPPAPRRPPRQEERSAQATRVCPLASVGTRKQPATRAGLSGIKLLLNIIMPHQKQNLARPGSP